jgi:hypothetical protein
MTRSIAVLCLLGCSSGGKTATEPLPPPTAIQRINIAMDSLNAGIKQLYTEGGVVELLQLLYPDPIGDVPVPPPVAAIITRSK